jgi:hydrogenase maturation protease
LTAADPSAGRVLVLGIGNPDRGDDAAGLAVARLLRPLLPPSVEVAQAPGEAADLLARLERCAAAVLVDACAGGAAAGTVRRFDVALAPLPAEAFGLSTHGFGLAEAIELARVLGRLPRRCIVYAVAGGSFALGAPLSPPVRAALPGLARRVAAELGQCGADVIP